MIVKSLRDAKRDKFGIQPYGRRRISSAAVPFIYAPLHGENVVEQHLL